MVRRHRLVETWLVSRYGYDWDEVHDEAEVLEHALSDRLLDEIDDQLGRPVRDPHGDPIPSRDGTLAQPDAVLLATLGAGERGRVARISDRDPEVLRALTAAGIGLDSEVAGGELDAAVADAVWVVRI
jgi:DtxR family Mn-dependent transcriptional regulator